MIYRHDYNYKATQHINIGQSVRASILRNGIVNHKQFFINTLFEYFVINDKSRRLLNYVPISFVTVKEGDKFDSLIFIIFFSAFVFIDVLVKIHAKQCDIGERRFSGTKKEVIGRSMVFFSFTVSLIFNKYT